VYRGAILRNDLSACSFNFKIEILIEIIYQLATKETSLLVLFQNRHLLISN